LRSAAVIVDPAIRITNVVRDPKDAHVLEAAVAGRADYIVSGDNDLLVLARYEAVEIVTPAAFVAMLSR
jgi:putative PIN family toxin of toxin-antitoxin system